MTRDPACYVQVLTAPCTAPLRMHAYSRIRTCSSYCTRQYRGTSTDMTSCSSSIGSFLLVKFYPGGWCYNVDCHSVGRVPSSYPRGVRRPTALLWFYPIPFLFVVSVCLGSLGAVRFDLLVSCSFSLSLVSFLFVSPCAAWSRFLFRPPFMFMYCVIDGTLLVPYL